MMTFFDRRALVWKLLKTVSFATILFSYDGAFLRLVDTNFFIRSPLS